MDERARRLLAAGNDVLPLLEELLGRDADRVGQELRVIMQNATKSWQAEAVREILFSHARTRSYLEEAVPESKSPRPFEGTDESEEEGVVFY